MHQAIKNPSNAMPVRFQIKDIALQAGVGVATVDRVVNDRGGVHERTRRRVEQAIEELATQERMVGLSGRTFFIDVIIEAPARFCDAARLAIAEEMPALLPAVFRVRQTMEAEIGDAELARLATRSAKRGSHGVILMGQDSAGTRASIAALSGAGIPVVTLATDVPDSGRIVYAGMDNHRAGRTSAFLIGKWLPKRPAKVLVSIRNSRFRGEVDRACGFHAMLRESFPYLEPVQLLEGAGAPVDFARKVSAVLERHPDITAIYSIGGNNRVILDALKDLGRSSSPFIAHDLDAANRALLRSGSIDVVLDHDLRRDMREACRAIMRYHRALPMADELPPSPIQIVTPTSLD